jgi:hypothetical protein
LEEIVTAFRANRIAHEYTQTNPASPERVFPLLCPVREAEWIPGWQYKLIYSDSGVAELGCVFTTQDPPAEEAKYSSRSNERDPATQETTWICTDYDPAAFRIGYVWVKPAREATELGIQLSRTADGNTRSHIRFRYTGLSEQGNREVQGYDRAWFETKMRGWETAINHYLTTGTMIDG